MTDIQNRIDHHAAAAEAAKASGDRETYWQERRAMLAAQHDLWNETHKEASCSTQS